MIVEPEYLHVVVAEHVLNFLERVLKPPRLRREAEGCLNADPHLAREVHRHGNGKKIQRIDLSIPDALGHFHGPKHRRNRSLDVPGGGPRRSPHADEGTRRSPGGKRKHDGCRGSEASSKEPEAPRA